MFTIRGVRGAVWFGFEHKSHPNQTNAGWIGSVCAVYREKKKITLAL